MALSIDNLVVGFALGIQRIPIGAVVALIAVVSTAMSLADLELGARRGEVAQRGARRSAAGVLSRRPNPGDRG
jgi:putative Mn2+ efflux pump MntP